MNNKKKVVFLFLFFSVITAVACAFDLGILKHSDIPNHFLGGMVAAILLFEIFLPKISKKENKIIFTVLFISFLGLGWEALEIAIAETRNAEPLFVETNANRAADLLFGFLGFISTPYLLKIKIENIYGAGKYKLS